MNDELRTRPEDQVLPTPNDHEGCHLSLTGRVRKMMTERLTIGIRRYGTKLQPFNGRNFMQDAWEEFMDLGVYLDGVARERDAMIALLKEVADLSPMAPSSTVVGVSDAAHQLLKSMGEQ